MELTPPDGTGDAGPGSDGPARAASRPWGAAAAGAALGLLLASAGIVVVELVSGGAGRSAPVPDDVASVVDLFRLPSGAARELFLVPAGPDASGEPRLSETLFPGEEPPRALAALLVANVGTRDAWDVDLAATPLRGRPSGGPWETLEPVGLPSGSGPNLPADVELRLRGIGGGVTAVRAEPGTLAQLLVALPRGRRIADLSDVQLGDVALVRDRLDLERVRRFRVDPAGTTSGR